MQLKYIPFALLSAFGIKYLINGIDLAGVACLATLGLTSFCLEKLFENKHIRDLQKEVEALKADSKKSAEEIETVKGFVSSVRLNGMRNNGLNRTAQQ